MGRTTNFLCGGSGCQPRSESMTKKPMMQVTAGGGYNRASSDRQATKSRQCGSDRAQLTNDQAMDGPGVDKLEAIARCSQPHRNRARSSAIERLSGSGSEGEDSTSEEKLARFEEGMAKQAA
jgi:hypothetical protein